MNTVRTANAELATPMVRERVPILQRHMIKGMQEKLSSNVEKAAMTSARPSEKLAAFYDFFEATGTERLNGLDQSFFRDMNADEKQAAWNFLADRFWLSSDHITGLYILDKHKAIDLFVKQLATPIEHTPYSSQRRYFESNRLLMLHFVHEVVPSAAYYNEMCTFATSEFSAIRGQFARSLPTTQVTREAMDALEKMIFTETDRVPLASAISTLMGIYGLNAAVNSPLINSIYLGLRSTDAATKIATLARMQAMQTSGDLFEEKFPHP